MKLLVPACLLCVLVFVSSGTYAGGINMNVNQSAEWCKTLNRLASTDPDATYYNPAGTAFMRQGFYTYMSDQVIYQPVRIDTKRSADLGLSRRSYYGEINSWYFLSGYMVLKFGSLALSGGGIGFGSGGAANYPRGLQELDVLPSAPYGLGPIINALYGRFGLGGPVGNPTVPAISRFKGSFTIYSVQVNAAYEIIKDRLSLSLGIRFYLGEATYDAKLFTPGPGAAYGGYIPLGSDLHAHQQGISAGIVTGISAKPLEGLILGIKGEWNSPFRLDTKSHDDKIFLLLDYRFKNNRRMEAQLPGNLGAGAAYKIASMRISASFTYSFNQYAQMKGREKGYTGGIDAGIGFDYTIEPIMLNIGTGYLYSNTGARPTAQSQLDDGLNSHSVSLGFSLFVGRGMQLTIAEVYTYYVPANVNRGQSNILKLLPAVVHRQSFNTAVGLTSMFTF